MIWKDTIKNKQTLTRRHLYNFSEGNQLAELAPLLTRHRTLILRRSLSATGALYCTAPDPPQETRPAPLLLSHRSLILLLS